MTTTSAGAPSISEPMRRVAVVPHPDRPQSHEVAVAFAEALGRFGITPMVPASVANDALRAAADAVDDGAVATSADAVVAVGGDGTLLRAFLLAPSVPLAGINCGDLGYLADVAPADIVAFAGRIAEGGLVIDERLTLEVTATAAGRAPVTSLALNDIVVAKGSDGRVPKLDVAVDDERFATFLADALVMSTPTGSTAYSFSARGPLVSPDLVAFTLVPVAPHSLWDRSLVLSHRHELVLTVVGDRLAQLTADGRQLGEFAAGATFRVRTSPTRARLLRWGAETFTGQLHRVFELDRTP